MTSADKRWRINYTDTPLADSEISDNRSDVIILVSPQHNDLKCYKQNLGETQREKNSYSGKLIIVKMTFHQLRRFNSSHKSKAPRSELMDELN